MTNTEVFNRTIKDATPILREILKEMEGPYQKIQTLKQNPEFRRIYEEQKIQMLIEKQLP